MIFGKSRINQILVLTSSPEASDIASDQLSLLNSPLNVIQAIIKDGNASFKYKLSGLSAVILVLEREGLQSEKFRDLAKKCLSELQKRDDFRVFVFRHDVQDSNWVTSLDNRGKEFIEDIFDMVQVEKKEPKPLSEIPSVLGPYLEKIGDERDAALGTRLRLGTSIIFGRVATVLQVLCLISTGVFFLFYFGAVIDPRPALQPDVLSVILQIAISIVLFPLITIPLYLLFRSGGNIQYILRGNKTLGFMMLIFIILIPAWVAVFSEKLFSGKWLIMGATIGIFLDIARRKGLQAQRTWVVLDGREATRPGGKISPKVMETAKEHNLNPLTLPLFSDDAPDVFISYSTHHSRGNPSAEMLHQKLLDLGTNSFRDVTNIREGTSFRRQLRQNIAKANTFICLADNASVRAYKDAENKTEASGWVAAELETALAMRRITGLPEIIILTEPDIIRNGNDNFPIFNLVLNANKGIVNNGQPRLIELKPKTLDVLVSGLRLYRFQVQGVFPAWLTNILDLFSIPLKYLGALGTFAGLVVWIFNFIWFANKGMPMPDWRGIALILAGFWLGYVGRLIAASRFQIKVTHASRFELTSVNVIAMLGLIVFEAILLPQVEIILFCWAILLSGFGWLLADRFIYNVMLSPKSTNHKIDYI
jgi:hypothetical protein